MALLQKYEGLSMQISTEIEWHVETNNKHDYNCVSIFDSQLLFKTIPNI